jgi:hypothetical protein
MTAPFDLNDREKWRSIQDFYAATSNPAEFFLNDPISIEKTPLLIFEFHLCDTADLPLSVKNQCLTGT